MLPDHPLLQYLAAQALTLAVEVPIVTVGLRRWYRVPAHRAATIGAAASLLTHPFVWFVLPAVVPAGAGLLGYLLTAEGFAWLAEAAAYWLLIRRDVVGLLLLSLLANVASFGLGVALQWLGFW